MATQVKPIPEGYHNVTPHLVVRDIAEAIDFYKKALGAQEIYRMDGPDGKLMHAEIKIGDSRVMLSPECCDRGFLAPSTQEGISSTLYVYVPDVDLAFDQAVKAGAKVMMAVTDMFWGDRTGEILDPSGHRWSLATHKVDLSPEEIIKGAEAFFASMAKTT